MAPMVPVMSRVGQGTANFGNGICTTPIGISPAMSPSSASAASIQDRSTRWGASGYVDIGHGGGGRQPGAGGGVLVAESDAVLIARVQEHGKSLPTCR